MTRVIGFIISVVNTPTAATPSSSPPTCARSTAKPDALSREQAAALPLTGLTAYRAVVHALARRRRRRPSHPRRRRWSGITRRADRARPRRRT